MGLLQKAAEQETNSPQIRESLFSEVERRLLKLRHTIEFYPALFKEFTKLFNIEKGALLIKEGDIFTLSSIIGYDETTKNRLRLSLNEYNEFKETNDNNILRKYYSIREFITINEIIITPFINNGILYALLISTDYSTEKKPESVEILNYAKTLSKYINENPLDKLKIEKSIINETKEEIANYLQKIKNSENKIVFIKLNLSDLIVKMQENDEHSTISSIKNSALRILHSFANTQGKVFQLKNNDILLTITDNTGSANIMIIQHQINSAFKSIFSNKLSILDLGFETLVWKNNSLDTILDHFIHDDTNSD